MLIFLGGLSVALLPGPLYYRGIGTIGAPWRLVLSGLDIAMGIGLLRRSEWARMATITIAALSIGLSIVALSGGLQHMREINIFSSFARIPVDGSIVWYLLRPHIRLVFARPTETTLADYNSLN
jgi:hypothetical protein